MRHYVFIIMGITLFLSACTNEDDAVILSAAASTRDAVEDIVELFNEEYPDVDVEVNFGGSGALKIQIEQGAPVDLFLSADTSHFEELVNEGYINEGITYIGNSLVLITPENSENVTSIDDLEEVRLLALGTPESVPAGRYGQSALEFDDLWETVEHKIVYAEDVRQVLQYVEVGEVDAGIVYHTDALTSDSVNIAATFDEASHEAIEYPLGILNAGADKSAAIDFYKFLQTNAALEVFIDYGFTAE